MRFKKIVLYLFLINLFISLFTIVFKLAKEREKINNDLNKTEKLQGTN